MMAPHPPHLLTLAQAVERPMQGFTKMLPWLLVLMGMVIVGGVVVIWVRNRLRADDSAPTEDVGFGLADLRAMRDRGEITQEEFETAKAKMIAKMKSGLDRHDKAREKADADTPPTPPPTLE